jgi:hypothetical protein
MFINDSQHQRLLHMYSASVAQAQNMHVSTSHLSRCMEMKTMTQAMWIPRNTIVLPSLFPRFSSITMWTLDVAQRALHQPHSLGKFFRSSVATRCSRLNASERWSKTRFSFCTLLAVHQRLVAKDPVPSVVSVRDRNHQSFE